MLTTMFDGRLEMQRQFVDVMRECFGDAAFSRVFSNTSEIINSAASFMTPYEQKRPNRKVLEMMDSVFAEVEVAIQRQWPSKREELMNKGIVTATSVAGVA